MVDAEYGREHYLLASLTPLQVKKLMQWKDQERERERERGGLEWSRDSWGRDGDGERDGDDERGMEIGRSIEGEWEIETDRERKGEDEADIDEKGVHLQKMEKKEIKNVSWKQ